MKHCIRFALFNLLFVLGVAEAAVDINFTAMTTKNALDKVGVPPDTMGAIGPSQFVVCLNSGIRSFKIDRDAGTAEPDGVLDCTLDAFLNGQGSGPFDPRIRYDHFQNEWVISAMDGFQTDFYIAVSETSENSGVITSATNWRVFTFNNLLVPDENGAGGTGGPFIDFDTLSYDENAYYLGTRTFGSAFGQTVYVVQKKSLFNGNTPVITAFRDIGTPDLPFGTRSVMGAINYDDDPKFGYFIYEDFATHPVTFLLWRVEDASTTHPKISPPIRIIPPDNVFTINSNGFPVPQKDNQFGLAGELDGGDTGLVDAAVVRHGKLFFSHDILVDKNGVAGFGIGDRMGSRFYEYDLSGGGKERLTTVPTLVQYATVFDSSETDPDNYFDSSLTVNKKGELLMGGSVSGNASFINGWYAFRKPSDPLNTIRAPILFTNSETGYYFELDAFFPGQRWGDYSSTSLDPTDKKTFWTVQQFCAEKDVWGIQVAQIKP